MLRTFCKSKITSAVITSKQPKYSGSIGLDKAIMEAADIMAGEQIHVLNANNGERFTTYVIEENEGTGSVILYGPATRKGEVGDGLVLLSYCIMETKESRNFKRLHIDLGENNQYKSK